MAVYTSHADIVLSRDNFKLAMDDDVRRRAELGREKTINRQWWNMKCKSALTSLSSRSSAQWGEFSAGAAGFLDGLLLIFVDVECTNLNAEGNYMPEISYSTPCGSLDKTREFW